MRRTAVLFAAASTITASAFALAAPTKKPPHETPATKANEAAEPHASSSAAIAEYAACPSTATFADVEPKGVVALLKNKCRTLRVPAGSAPTEIAEDDVLVVACVRDGEAMEPKDCGLRAYVEIAKEDAIEDVALVADGELAISARATEVAKRASPANGTRFRLVVVDRDGDRDRTASSPLVWREPQMPYGNGAFVWLPIPMLTTDFSSGPKGYRLGVTPLAIAVGTRFFPSATSKGYFGASLFAAWNLLVPNDTQTLSNTTAVRINYESFGGGALFDAAGFVSVGVGLGHTFTTDGRTDFRCWFYFGPRLLGFGNDF